MAKKPWSVFAALAVVTLLVTGCGSSRTDSSAQDSSNRASGTTAATGFPLTVENCGRKVTIKSPPQRVVLLGDEEVPLLASVGALGKVVAKIGDYPTGIFGSSVDAALAKIPNLNSQVAGGGGAQASLESVISQKPDLVIGYETTTVTRAGLQQAGIPLVVNPSFCGEVGGGDRGATVKPVSFDNVYDQVSFYGQLFGQRAQATSGVAQLRDRIAAVRNGYQRTSRTAAALYVGKSAGLIEAYGGGSMVNAELQAAGLVNVFGSAKSRVFSVSTESLLAKDPDVLILLSTGDPSSYRGKLLQIAGTEDLSAVKTNALVSEFYLYADPATQLTVTGTERLARKFGTAK
ncbi:ABC transporter substrate-binding protein [Streptomyces sp. DW26H14]|uniref:ABC transporter substrate-binding protein n=1 Tax=Streptomyces sp. DW26H14 TaxID=3435395 RepID=UPI00403D5906